jgi:hypothetical protein
VHSDRNVLAPDVGRVNLRRIGVAHDWGFLRVRYVGRTVAVLAFRVLGVDLDQLGEVATVAHCGRNRGDVGLKSIGTDLEGFAGRWRRVDLR